MFIDYMNWKSSHFLSYGLNSMYLGIFKYITCRCMYRIILIYLIKCVEILTIFNEIIFIQDIGFKTVFHTVKGRTLT